MASSENSKPITALESSSSISEPNVVGDELKSASPRSHQSHSNVEEAAPSHKRSTILNILIIAEHTELLVLLKTARILQQRGGVQVRFAARPEYQSLIGRENPNIVFFPLEEATSGDSCKKLKGGAQNIAEKKKNKRGGTNAVRHRHVHAQSESSLLANADKIKKDRRHHKRISFASGVGIGEGKRRRRRALDGGMVDIGKAVLKVKQIKTSLPLLVGSRHLFEAHFDQTENTRTKPDIIVASPSALSAVHIAERLQIPVCLVGCVPWLPTATFRHPEQTREVLSPEFLESSLGEASSSNILRDARVLKEGYLEKKRSKISLLGFRKEYFWVLDRSQSDGKKERYWLAYDLNKDCVSPNHVISLSKVEVSSTNSRSIFKIMTSTRELTLKCATLREYAEWVLCFTEVQDSQIEEEKAALSSFSPTPLQRTSLRTLQPSPALEGGGKGGGRESDETKKSRLSVSLSVPDASGESGHLVADAGNDVAADYNGAAATAAAVGYDRGALKAPQRTKSRRF
eukprot:jgi/Bigna1/84193/fgenesh1_pg.125_\